MESATRNFHIGDILSITTGRLVSPSHMQGVYAILNYMTDDDLFTHQLPRAGEECKPYLLAQHPQLATVNAEEVTRDNWREWLKEQIARFGYHLPVAPLPAGIHKHRDPLMEAVDMMGTDQVMVISQPDEDGSFSCNTTDL